MHVWIMFPVNEDVVFPFFVVLTCVVMVAPPG